MQTQKFKGDDTELKMEAAASPAFDLCSAALDDFLELGASSSPFVLMLYDENRAPFSDRVPRDAFVQFMSEALTRFPFTGTFESYIFILKAIFGEATEVQFSILGNGKLQILVNAGASIDFDFIGREFVDGAYETFQMVTTEGDPIQFIGLSGIDSEYKLKQLLAEIIPAGIMPTIILTFFEIYSFIAEDTDGISSMVDHLGNQIVFLEV